MGRETCGARRRRDRHTVISRWLARRLPGAIALAFVATAGTVAHATIVTQSVMWGSSLVGEIVWTPGPGMSKTIRSSPA